jgi:hypothetical protein
MVYCGMVDTTTFDQYFQSLEHILSTATDDAGLFHAIVNAPFHDRVSATHIDLGIVVLLLVNEAENTVDRIALSNTEQAAGAVKMSEKPFREIKIPFDCDDNAIVQAIKTSQPQTVTDWQYLFVPALSPRAARFNQAGAGIECSHVYPLNVRGGGAIIFSYYQENKNIVEEHREFMEGYIELVNARLSE